MLPDDIANAVEHAGLEGLQAVGREAYSVQYHPEHAPGPHDAEYLFDRFIDLIRNP